MDNKFEISKEVKDSLENTFKTIQRKMEEVTKTISENRPQLPDDFLKGTTKVQQDLARIAKMLEEDNK